MSPARADCGSSPPKASTSEPLWPRCTPTTWLGAMPTAKHFILQRVVGYTAFASTSPASGLSGTVMTLKQQQSWMEEVVRSLKGSAEKYDLLAEAAHNLESKLHFQKQANEF